MAKDMEIMVIAPHPDDAEFGVAGTVARWTKEGRPVVYVICTNGNKGTSDRSLSPARLADIREEEQIAAAEILGVSDVVFLRNPDAELEDTPEFRKQMVRAIRQYRPRTVVTCSPYRRYIWHRDHRITGQVALDAVYPYARDHLSYPDLLDEDLQPHKVEEMLFWASEDINHRSDITETFHQKIAALRCHKSQFAAAGLQQIEVWLRARCESMAEGEVFGLAEGFHRIAIAP